MHASPSQPFTSTALLGRGFAAVRACLGAPLGVSSHDDCLRLAYLGEDGNLVDVAVELTRGVVSSVRRGLRKTPPVAEEPLVGQATSRVLAQLGPPLRTVVVGAGEQLEFHDRVVTTCAGVVVCVVPVLPSAPAPTARASA